MLTFGNPLGFLALLALPVILAIHFLQRESRRVTTSTLFLLEQLAPESAQGRRVERLRNSVPLWLQLVAALLVTWLLVQPRWLRRDSIQRVVIVLDSSVSMTAFRDQLHRRVDEHTSRLARAAARTEWQLLESNTTRPTLYAGGMRGELMTALQKWKPHLGTHAFDPALQLGQTLLRGSGTLVLVTDRNTSVPGGVQLLAVGQPIENCGFAGVTFEEQTWRVLVRNHGQTTQRRSWWMEAKGERSGVQEIFLEPGQSSALSGSMPPGVSACELVLSGDGFTLDDRLPLVLPQPKRLQLATQPNTAFADFFTQFVASIEASEGSVSLTSKPDLQLAVYDPFAPGLPTTTAIVFEADAAPASKLLPGSVVAENHPLTSGLNWSGLLCRDSFRVPSKPGDQALLWQGDRPLIFLRPVGGELLLIINFDLRTSNATRLPAFVLLLHRFVEQIRAAKVAPETRNVDTNQVLTVATDPALPRPTLNGEAIMPVRAPAEPGFFEVRQADAVLLSAAAQFADAREADFREASEVDPSTEAISRMVERNSEADFLAPIWTLALGMVVIGSWVWRQS